MDLRKSIAHQTSFSQQLAKHLASSVPVGSNHVFSPASMHAALSLLASGSDGETQEQLLSVLLQSGSTTDLNVLSSQIVEIVLADGSPSGGPKLTFANGVWVDESLPLIPIFKDVVTSVYKAETQNVNFTEKAEEAREGVNSWVQRLTNGLIKEILPSGSVDCMTRLVLGNALHFKGAWLERFDAALTKESEFHLLDGSTIQTPFMTSKEQQYLSAYNDFKVLRLPYRQGDDKRQFSMYIFLPDARDGLSTLAEKFSEPGFLERHVPGRKVDVNRFKIPKFKVSFGFEASQVLKAMGLVSPFGPGADLTGMVEPPLGRQLYVYKVFHRSFVEVNEEGTEAGAATAVVIKLRGMMLALDFVADHPFLFMIREDKTGLVLFIGHVLNPQTAE